MRATFAFGYLQICSAHFCHYRISTKKSARGLSRKTVKMNSGPYPPRLCLLVHDLSLLETIMHASAHHIIHSFTKLLPPAKAARPLGCNLHLLIRISSSSSWSRAQFWLHPLLLASFLPLRNILELQALKNYPTTNVIQLFQAPVMMRLLTLKWIQSGFRSGSSCVSSRRSSKGIATGWSSYLDLICFLLAANYGLG